MGGGPSSRAWSHALHELLLTVCFMSRWTCCKCPYSPAKGVQRVCKTWALLQCYLGIRGDTLSVHAALPWPGACAVSGLSSAGAADASVADEEEGTTLRMCLNPLKLGFLPHRCCQRCQKEGSAPCVCSGH